MFVKITTNHPFLYAWRITMALCGDDHQKLLARINRIEGQLRGLKIMVQENRECMEVLKQVAASAGALRSLGMVILEDHLKGCVASAVLEKGPADESIHQVIEIFNKFAK